MRTKTLASLLILCGSTAAIAAIPHSPDFQAQTNNTTANTTLPPPDTSPAPQTSPAPTPPSPDTTTTPSNTTDDAQPK